MQLPLVEGLLKIEDVLPFFPNFVTIDNFKDAICDSLEQYNKQVQIGLSFCAFPPLGLGLVPGLIGFG